MINEDDRGFLLGDGVFETLRVEDGRPLLLRRHLRRLEAALETISLGIDLAEVERRIVEAAQDLGAGSGSLRASISRGPGPRGLLPPEVPRPTVIVRAGPAGPRQSAPVTAIISQIRRNEGSPLSRIKSLSYQEEVLARMEAGARGADDAIMLNNEGEAASTSMANLYALKDGSWVTPPLRAGLLPGIVRSVLLDEGAVEEGVLTVDDLHAFPLARSNSLVGVEPLGLIGGAAPDPGALRRLTEVLAAVERREQ